MVRTRWVAIVVGIILVCGLSPSAWADPVTPTLAVSPVSPTATVGSTVEVDVSIANVMDLYAYQFDLTFNPAVLQIQTTGITEGAFLATGGSTLFLQGTIDNKLGNITFNFDTLENPIPGVTGGGTLVEFDFLATGPGVSPFGLANAILLDSNLSSINPFTTASESVTVQGSTKVPEPSSALLLLAGVSGLFLLTLTKRIS